MSSEAISKLQPHRTMSLQGFDGYGAGAALWGASATGFTLSGVWRDQADFAVLDLFIKDDPFGHPRFSYLPDGNFAGITLAFDIQWTGVQAFESKKFAWTDWAYLNCLDGSGVEHQVGLSTLATCAGGRTGASAIFTLNCPGTPVVFDRVTLWVHNLAFDYIATGGETLNAICANIAAQINATDWVANGPVVLSAAAVGSTVVITAEPGADGNMITAYELHKNTNLYFTPASATLAGGSSDNVSWHVSIDFSALGWTDLQKLWLTFAAPLANAGG